MKQKFSGLLFAILLGVTSNTVIAQDQSVSTVDGIAAIQPAAIALQVVRPDVAGAGSVVALYIGALTGASGVAVAAQLGAAECADHIAATVGVATGAKGFGVVATGLGGERVAPQKVAVGHGESFTKSEQRSVGCAGQRQTMPLTVRPAPGRVRQASAAPAVRWAPTAPAFSAALLRCLVLQPAGCAGAG